jgi:flagellar hook protein FlgE
MMVFNSAVAGVLNASQRFEKVSAQAIAATSEVEGARDVVSAFVEQKMARTAFQASVEVMKTVNEMTGQVLNLKI